MTASAQSTDSSRSSRAKARRISPAARRRTKSGDRRASSVTRAGELSAARRTKAGQLRAQKRIERRRRTFERIRTAKDPATEYARAVARGAVVAGPQVRDACRRHLADLERGAERGLVWDVAAAARYLNFKRDVLKLNGGEWEGKPFESTAWQCFVGGSLFGWKRTIKAPWLGGAETTVRRFTTGYIETGKGSGKSPEAAAIGLYCLTSDNEWRAEIYAAATKKDQAMVLFRDAVAMVDLSPELTHVIKKSGVGERTWNLAYLAGRSFFRPISSDDGQSGPRPHVSLLDEIHEHADNNVVEMLKAGQKNRRQPMMVMITNSGVDKNSVCWAYHDYAVKVASGALQDDSFFGFVCGLDKGEDPFKSEACWPKANPSLEEFDIPGLKYLREQVAAARGMPSKASLVRRLNFCEWVESVNPAIPRHVWEGAEDTEFDLGRLRGRRCWGGLDLSSTTDLTAAAYMFEPVADDPHWRLLVRLWIPGDELAAKEDRDKVPYIAWRDAGHIIALPGRAIDKLAVARQCAADAEAFDLQQLGYDRWRIEDFKRILDDEGIDLPLVPFGQGFQSMTPAVEAFETALVGVPAKDDTGNVKHARLNKPLRHPGNPCLTWCAANAVYASDSAGCRKPDKKKATGRIDGIVAAIMASGLASRGETTSTSYPGVLTV
jgi:phage terminase large subunit-like protein